MEEIRHETEQSEAGCNDDELIFFAQFVKDVLEVLLDTGLNRAPEDSVKGLTKGSESFTGLFSSLGIGQDVWRKLSCGGGTLMVDDDGAFARPELRHASARSHVVDRSSRTFNLADKRP